MSAANFATIVILARALEPSQFGAFVLAYARAPLRERAPDRLRHPAAQRARPGEDRGRLPQLHALDRRGAGRLLGRRRRARARRRAGRLGRGRLGGRPPLRARSGARRLAAPGVHAPRPLHGDAHADGVRDRRRRLRRPGRARPRARRGRPGLRTPPRSYAVALSSGVAALLGGWAIRRSLRGRIERAFLRENWSFGKWLGAAIAASWLSTQLFFYLTAVVLNAAATAGLKAAQTVLGPLNAFLLFITTVLPIRLSAARERDGEEGTAHGAAARLPRDRSRSWSRYGALVAIFAGPILETLYGAPYARLRRRGSPLRRLLRRHPRRLRALGGAQRAATDATSVHRERVGGGRRRRGRPAARARLGRERRRHRDDPHGARHARRLLARLSPLDAPAHAAVVAVADPLVHVVVLNLNGTGFRDTKACLDSLAALDYPRFRTVVVDNGSADDSAALIRQAFPDGRGARDGREPRLRRRRRTSASATPSSTAPTRSGSSTTTRSPSPARSPRSSRPPRRTRGAGIVGSAVYRFDNPAELEAWGGGTYSSLLGIATSTTRPVAASELAFITGASMFLHARARGGRRPLRRELLHVHGGRRPVPPRAAARLGAGGRGLERRLPQGRPDDQRGRRRALATRATASRRRAAGSSSASTPARPSWSRRRSASPGWSSAASAAGSCARSRASSAASSPASAPGCAGAASRRSRPATPDSSREGRARLPLARPGRRGPRHRAAPARAPGLAAAGRLDAVGRPRIAWRRSPGPARPARAAEIRFGWTASASSSASRAATSSSTCTRSGRCGPGRSITLIHDTIPLRHGGSAASRLAKRVFLRTAGAALHAGAHRLGDLATADRRGPRRRARADLGARPPSGSRARRAHRRAARRAAARRSACSTSAASRRTRTSSGSPACSPGRRSPASGGRLDLVGGWDGEVERLRAKVDAVRRGPRRVLRGRARPPATRRAARSSSPRSRRGSGCRRTRRSRRACRSRSAAPARWPSCRPSHASVFDPLDEDGDGGRDRRGDAARRRPGPVELGGRLAEPVLAAVARVVAETTA